MVLAALLILIAAGGWLMAVGVLLALRPQRALDILSLTASSHRINLTEQGLRMLGGFALVARAASSQLPALFEVGGWFIVLSSAALMVVPLRIHAGYAIWWAKRLPHWAVRAVAPFSIVIGLGLIYAAI